MAETQPNCEKYFRRAEYDLKPNLFILRTLNTHLSSHSASASSTDAKHIITPPLIVVHEPAAGAGSGGVGSRAPGSSS